MNNDETYTPCTKCGRPMAYCKGQCCGKTKGCQCKEYCGSTCAAIRPGEPKCPPQAVIPSLTVESVSNLKDLADCFVHVTDINTTFYIDDKHRIMTTWAGLVSVDDYDFDANPLNLRSQIAYDSKNNVAAIYDKQGANYIFQISDINNDYMLLENKPRINGVMLEGNKTSADLGILEADEVALVFDTVADMKQATNLTNGSYARTLGFHSVNDGGGATYKITNTGTANEMDIIAIDTLFAHLIKPAIATPEIYGAYGNGTNDDTSCIQRCFDTNTDVDMVNTYLITDSLTFNGSICGRGTGIIKTNPTARIAGSFIESSNNLTVDGMYFDCTSNVPFTLDDKFLDYNEAIIAHGKLEVSNCEFHNLYERFIKVSNNSVSYVNIHDNLFSSDNKTNVYMSSCLSISSIINPDAIITVHNNIMQGYEFEYVDTYDNDYNVNASGIVLSNVNVKEISIDSNTFDHLGRHGSVSGNEGLSRLDVIDCYFNVTPLKLTNNKITNCHWTALRLHGASGAFIDNNLFTVARACSEPLILISDSYNSAGDAPVGCDNVTITNNKLLNKDIVFEQCIYINSFTSASISGDEAGFHGHVDNLTIANNDIEFCAKYIFMFDYSLKKFKFTNNNVIGDFSNVNGGTRSSIIVNDTRPVMKSATYGKSFANTVLNINNNTMITNGSPISTRTTDVDLVPIYSAMKQYVQHNIMWNTSTVGYAIYGTAGQQSELIGNLIRSGNGGIFNANKSLNNIIFYSSPGAAESGVTTSQNNSTYTN